MIFSKNLNTSQENLEKKKLTLVSSYDSLFTLITQDTIKNDMNQKKDDQEVQNILNINQKISILPKDKSSSIISKHKKRIGIDKNRKKLFLEKIFFESKKIKQAALEAGIKYSSAKTLMFYHRKKLNQASQGRQICGFEPINQNSKKVQIISNNFFSNLNYTYEQDLKDMKENKAQQKAFQPKLIKNIILQFN